MKKLIDRFVILFLVVNFPHLATAQDAGTESKSDKNEMLSFLVGVWNTEHTLPVREGEPVIVRGEATIEWEVGGRWLQHEFHADFAERGDVFMTTMMNYSPSKKMYNFYMFDHFGGDAGVFYGDWISENAIEVTAKFEEEDGSQSYQKFTLTKVSNSEVWISRAFSRDGKHYHFELKGVYTRQEG